MRSSTRRIAGTDCLEGNPLGRLKLSKEAVVARDELIIQSCQDRTVPIAKVTSGGYQLNNAHMIANSVIASV